MKKIVLNKNFWCLAAVLVVLFLTFRTAEAAPAIFTVTKIADTNDGVCNSDCSLREAMAAAAAGDKIVFSPAFSNSAQTITLSDAVNFRALVINKNLTIEGRGANLTTIARSPAAAQFGIFQIQSGATVTISGLTIKGGSNATLNGGGGIFNAGSTTLDKVHVTGNTSASFGGGIYNETGGTLIINSSTVSNNTSTRIGGSTGGGITNRGVSLTVTNSTISGNRAAAGTFNGGGINSLDGAVLISNSTIVDNEAAGGQSAGGVYRTNGSTSGDTTVRSSIIATNCTRTTNPICSQSATPDVAGDDNGSFGRFASGGYNLIGNPGAVTFFSQFTDQKGTSENPFNPPLAPLGDYGGRVPTHRLVNLNSNPAVDKGKSFGLSFDARGFNRRLDFPNFQNAIQGDGTDIGAVEERFSNRQVVTSDGDAQIGAPGCGDGCSLREALATLDPLATESEIAFDSPSLRRREVTITLTQGELNLDVNVYIALNRYATDAPNKVTISGNNRSRVFSIQPNRTVTLGGLTITGGNAGAGADGGAILNRGTLIVVGCDIAANQARNGGAIYNENVLGVALSTIHDNTATTAGGGAGGAIAGGGTLVLDNSNVTSNRSSSGDNNGGGLWLNNTATIIQSTVAGNGAAGANSAGGIYVNGGAVTIINSIVSNLINSAAPTVRGAFTSGGGNVVSVVGSATGFNQSRDQTGTIANPLNARLIWLADNGGPTLTIALSNNSPAINNGVATTLSDYTTDQRGADRAGAPDSGSFEFNGTFTATLPPTPRGTVWDPIISNNPGTATYRVTGGSLPPGTMLTTTTNFASAAVKADAAFAPQATVALTGTPTAAGIYNFDLTVTDNGDSFTQNYQVEVTEAAPTAASVSVAGRVSATGAGLRNAIVTLIDTSGRTRTARTGAFGYYRFDEVEVGRTYIVTVASKRFVFDSQVVPVNDDLTELDFAANDRRR